MLGFRVMGIWPLNFKAMEEKINPYNLYTMWIQNKRIIPYQMKKMKLSYGKDIMLQHVSSI